MTRVLVVDDEPNLRHSVGYALRVEGYDVVHAEDGEQGLAAFRSAKPDLVILDVMLPAMDGFEVCRRIRRESSVPVLMLTARGTELDRVVGLEIGADDYLVKPFSMRELVARVRAMLRRATATNDEASAQEVVLREGLQIDVPRHLVLRDGVEVALRPKEFDLLLFLSRQPGRVFSRDQLLSAVWGLQHTGDSRTVDTHIKKLREQLGDDADRPRWIETLRGVGYRFRETTDRGAAAARS
ncbi:MAG: response regulator transcription factor [Chloroflexota bacterium]|nr:response regulator transcription factor [Chloroflexota bacterium]